MTTGHGELTLADAFRLGGVTVHIWLQQGPDSPCYTAMVQTERNVPIDELTGKESCDLERAKTLAHEIIRYLHSELSLVELVEQTQGFEARSIISMGRRLWMMTPEELTTDDS